MATFLDTALMEDTMPEVMEPRGANEEIIGEKPPVEEVGGGDDQPEEPEEAEPDEVVDPSPGRAYILPREPNDAPTEDA